MELIICEKPAQAKEYALVFGKKRNSTFKSFKGYFSDGKMTISYAVGHLIQLADASLYNPSFKTWNINDLPIIPEQFKYVISSNTKEQYSILKNLIQTHTTIYNAADAEREGELIFRLILNQTNIDTKQKVIKRIWLTDYKYETIINSYQNAKNQDQYDNLYKAAKARQISDWLIGINATRMLSLSSNTHTTLTLGRVQTAILSLIVERYKNHINFIPKDTYKPVLYLTEIPFPLSLEETYYDEQDAKTVVQQVEQQKDFKLNLLKGKKALKQPLLFSLTDLQVLCNKKHGFSASKTLEYAQHLYESKLISYPRTSSNYLSNALVDDVKDTLSNLKQNYYENKNAVLHSFLKEQDINKHFIFNDEKTSDHYAILPLPHQKNVADNLGPEQKIVLNEIISIFFQCFSESAQITTYDVSYNLGLVNDKEQIFSFSFKVTDYLGFLFFQEKTKEEVDPNILNKIDFSKKHQLENCTLQLGKTTQPLLFTEATLLQAMKNPIAYEKITENKDFIKSLGTPATNDKFLPILLKRNYVAFNKKYIVPEPIGISIIEKLSNTKLTSIALTANIEAALENINKGVLSYEKYMISMYNYTKTITEEIKQFSADIGTNLKVENKERNLCPGCKKGYLYLSKTKAHYYCSNYAEKENKCEFMLYRVIAGYTLKKSDIEQLTKSGKTKQLNLKNSKGAEYKGYLMVTEDKKTKITLN